MHYFIMVVCLPSFLCFMSLFGKIISSSPVKCCKMRVHKSLKLKKIDKIGIPSSNKFHQHIMRASKSLNLEYPHCFTSIPFPTKGKWDPE